MLNDKIKFYINYFLDTDESSPKCNLNETFEIKNETIELGISFPSEATIKEQNVQSDKLDNSTRKEGIPASPLKMEGYSRTSTPNGMKFIRPYKKIILSRGGTFIGATVSRSHWSDRISDNTRNTSVCREQKEKQCLPQLILLL
jgi:hypothetical protein